VAKVAPDPSDGLPAMEAQEWAADKHAALRRYLDISHAARRKFLMAGGAAYFELFSGPGRLFLKGTNQFIDGSPLVAHLEATRTRTNFTNIYLADEQQTFCSAVETRLKRLGASPTTHPLRSEPAAKRIAKQLRPDALNVGFLDPYNLGDLPLSIFETFAPLQRIDLLVHVRHGSSACLARLDEGKKRTARSLRAWLERRSIWLAGWCRGSRKNHRVLAWTNPSTGI
jgi:three-Cys-motif partner protein